MVQGGGGPEEATVYEVGNCLYPPGQVLGHTVQESVRVSANEPEPISI